MTIIKTHLLANQPYDESESVYDDEEVVSTFSPSPRAASDPRNTQNRMADSEDEFEHDDVDATPLVDPSKQKSFQQSKPQSKQSTPQQQQRQQPNNPPPNRPGGGGGGGGGGHEIEESEEEDDDEEESESSDEEDGKVNATTEGTYDPADYEHLPVSQEIKELFQYITRYTPQTIDLDHKLKPFIPDFIPAVGDIDAFLKVTRPDGKSENLGLQIIDEPSAKQSDPTVLDLQLRSISKQTSAKQMIVRSIDEPDKNPKAIDNWITSITELHRQKPPQNVHYTKTMPDIETLMQEWSPEIEEMLKTTNLPSADLDCDLNEYIDIICSMLDIPVYTNRIQSLHVLFTLYSEFKNSQHFNQLAHDNLLSNELKHAQPIPSKGMNQSESLSFE